METAIERTAYVPRWLLAPIYLGRDPSLIHLAFAASVAAVDALDLVVRH
jgi:hypothetical protein